MTERRAEVWTGTEEHYLQHRDDGLCEYGTGFSL